MGYFDGKKSATNLSQKEPLLPLFEQSVNFTTSYLIPRSTLRQRERFILILIVLCFVIFSIGGVFFLPELKAGKQFAYKHIEKAGSDIIGLPNTNLNDQDKSQFVIPPPRSQFIDRKKIADKINNDLGANNVLPRPDLNKLQLRHDGDWSPIPFHSGEDPDPEIRHRRDTVREMMQHAWSNYVKYAWGDNELNPISKSGHSAGIFGNTKLGASIIDGLDTLWIMGLNEEYKKARDYVQNELDFNSINSEVSVFEFNIRFVGGLLTAYALTKDELYIRKAEEIAEKLLPSFNTPTGIPYSLINPATGECKNYNWASSSSSILSEFGTMHLEFLYLSYVTGKPIYKDKVVAVRNYLDKIEKKDGLYYNYLNPQSGRWGQAHVSMGALADSFYEYLLKAYLQSDKQDEQSRRMYIEAIDALLNKITRTTPGGLLYFGQLKYDNFERKMEHLACFSGGMIALGGQTLFSDENKAKYISIGANITNTCHESYVRTKTQLGPETFTFSDNSDKITSLSNERYYIQRPEVIESYFYLWRITKDPKYRDWAWSATQAILNYCRVDNGFVGIKNVYSDKSPKDDVQQSFFLAETLKYLYLIFSDDKLISFDQWVFNSEGHPLPIANFNPAYKTKTTTV